MTFLRIHTVLYSLRNVYSTSVPAVEHVKNDVSSLISKITKENQYDILSDVITPLWKVDYREQILLKKKWSRSVLNFIKTKNLPRVKTILYPVIPSPQIIGYRNKDEFNVRTSVDGNPKTVGYFVGSGSKGDIICIPPLHLENVKPGHIEIAKAFQDFIRKSPLTACHQLNDGGFWRGIEIQSNREGDMLAVIHAHPSGILESDIENIKESIRQHFQENSPSIKSLYMQLCPHSRCTPEQAPFTLLYGTPNIFENIDRYIFRISPGSFYHTNIESLPLLYECALKCSQVNKTYTLFDLNCGIGTFSMFASSYVRGCVGIDVSPWAVEDAVFNVNHNNISNCHFIHGSLAKELKGILKEHESTMNIAAVINPGRMINRELVRVLRRCVQLKKLVYISSKADNINSLRSFIDLCHPKFDLSNPFYLTAIHPVDMYPHTQHCDLVMLFQR